MPSNPNPVKSSGVRKVNHASDARISIFTNVIIFSFNVSLCKPCPISCANTAQISSTLRASFSVSYKTIVFIFPKPVKYAFIFAVRFDASIT